MSVNTDEREHLLNSGTSGQPESEINPEEQDRKRRNLSLLSATVFIVGEVAGGGILSLPHAVAGAGWSGVFLIIFCCISAGISGICLAKSWLILEERYDEYKNRLTRKPFATIGYRAYGKWMSVTVSIVMDITRFGASTVFLLLTAGLIKNVVQKLIHIGICSWIPIVGALLTPIIWCGSPADFWPVAYIAMISTVIGSILLIINIIIESPDHFHSATYSAPSFKSFFLSFGNILFAFGGASAFPNFQNDMREKKKFPKAVTFGFLGLLLLYVSVSAGGYAVYGSGTQPNIIESMGISALSTVVHCCFIIHCFFAFPIIINPVLLEIEELLNLPETFNWKRCLFRTLMMILLIFTAESIPSFGRILDLIGGSTVTLMAFIMPPLFYFKLCSQTNENWQQRNIPIYYKVILTSIALVGIIGGIASTYSSIDSWISSPNLEPPCYVRQTNNTSF